MGYFTYQQAHTHLKRLDEVDNILLTKLIVITCLLNNNIVRFSAIRSYFKIKHHFEIWADYNFATKAFLHLLSMNLHLKTVLDLNH